MTFFFQYTYFEIHPSLCINKSFPFIASSICLDRYAATSGTLYFTVLHFIAFADTALFAN